MILNYLGIINLLFFGLVIIWLAKRSKIKLHKYVVSHLADYKKMGFLFNLGLAFFSLNQIIFSVVVYQHLKSYSVSPLALLFLILGGVFLVFASLFSLGKNPKFHHLFGWGSATFVLLGVLFLIPALYAFNSNLGLIALGVVPLVPVSYLLLRHFRGAFWESTLFVPIITWNLVFSMALIG